MSVKSAWQGLRQGEEGALSCASRDSKGAQRCPLQQIPGWPLGLGVLLPLALHQLWAHPGGWRDSWCRTRPHSRLGGRDVKVLNPAARVGLGLTLKSAQECCFLLCIQVLGVDSEAPARETGGWGGGRWPRRLPSPGLWGSREPCVLGAWNCQRPWSYSLGIVQRPPPPHPFPPPHCIFVLFTLALPLGKHGSLGSNLRALLSHCL